MDSALQVIAYSCKALSSALFISCLLLGCSSLKQNSLNRDTPTTQTSLVTSNANNSQKKNRELPPQAMTVGEISSLDPKVKDCANQLGWEQLMNNQIQMRGFERKNPEELIPEEREFNATAHQIIWTLRIHCAAINKER
jgi:hypothetical protein